MHKMLVYPTYCEQSAILLLSPRLLRQKSRTCFWKKLQQLFSEAAPAFGKSSSSRTTTLKKNIVNFSSFLVRICVSVILNI